MSDQKSSRVLPSCRSLLAVIFFLVIVVAKSKGISACSLCRNGDEITKPDHLIGIQQPIPLATCGDLSNVMQILNDDSELCLKSRALSSLCGCPVSTTSCTLCPDGFDITLPLQILDGLITLDTSGAEFGLNTTCELVESFINDMDETDQQCLDLPFEELQQLCACSNRNAINNNNSLTDNSTAMCNFCANGKVLAVPPTNSSIHLQGNWTPCADAMYIASNLTHDSSDCNVIQEASTKCGCHDPVNACELCPGETAMSHSKKEIMLSDGTMTSCSILEHRMRQVDKSRAECLLADKYAAECGGCTSPTTAVEFQPCTLCPLGEKVPYPERNIVGIDGMGFDYIEHNCGIIEASLQFTDASTILCHAIHIVAKLCGCVMQDDACSICGEGNIMKNPLATASWMAGHSQRAFPVVVSTIDIDMTFTCELVDSALSSWYHEDNEMCSFIKLTRGNKCGCTGSGPREVKLLIWTQRCVGILSLIGTLLITSYILTRPKMSRWSMFHQLMFGVSVFDGFSSIAFILGTVPVPENTAFYGAFGNEVTCNIQGWIFQARQISMYYNVALSAYFLLVIKYGWSDRRFQHVGKYIHTALLLFGFVLAFASIPFQEPNYRWCYVAWPPIGSNFGPGIAFFLLPVGLSIIAITILTIQLVCFVNHVDKKTRHTSIGSMEQSMASRTFWQSLWFLAAFYIVWPVLFTTFLMDHNPGTFWVFMVGSVLGPSQGFLNALIFFNRQRAFITRKINMMLEANSQHSSPSLQWVSSMMRTGHMLRQHGSSSNVEPSSKGHATPGTNEISQAHSDLECIPSMGQSHPWTELESNGDHFSMGVSCQVEHTCLEGPEGLDSCNDENEKREHDMATKIPKDLQK